MFSHYHNIRYQHPPERPSGRFGTRKPSKKQATNHPKDPPEQRAGSCFYGMHEYAHGVHSAEIHAIQPGWNSSFPAFFPSENGSERGRSNLLRQPSKRYRRNRKTGFQHVQESQVRRRPAITLWQVARTTHHTIHRRFDSWLDSRVTTVIKTAKSDDSTLESRVVISYWWCGIESSILTLWRVVGKSRTRITDDWIDLTEGVIPA